MVSSAAKFQYPRDIKPSLSCRCCFSRSHPNVPPEPYPRCPRVVSGRSLTVIAGAVVKCVRVVVMMMRQAYC